MIEADVLYLQDFAILREEPVVTFGNGFAGKGLNPTLAAPASCYGRKAWPRQNVGGDVEYILNRNFLFRAFPVLKLTAAF